MSFRFCSHLLPISVVLATFLVGSPASAQPANYLVKGSGPTVYYNANDGKRYFFPNESVYKSWYPDFASVAQVSDAQLAALPLGGNVMYRPGSTLVKITTDPKVYAVSRYGVLHWITSEAVAKEVYGADWNKKVMDVSDAFFTNYIVGYQIDAANQYNPNEELATATSPGDNIRPAGYVPPATSPVPPVVAPNAPTVATNVSASQAVLNQTVFVFATVENSTLPITKIVIKSDASATPLMTCLNTMTCSYSFTVLNAPTVITYFAEATDANGVTFVTAASARPVLNTLAASDQTSVNISPQSVTAGSRVNFTADATKIPIIQNHRVFALIPGEKYPVLWKDCGTASTCAASTPFYRNTYLYSHVTGQGQTYVSPTTLVTVTGDAPKPTITVKSKPAPNQVVLDIAAPYGEMIMSTVLVDGITIDDTAMAICDASCTLTVQINRAGSLSAFTWVGGKYEQSNIVTVTPE